jgi:hypothetical protein
MTFLVVQAGLIFSPPAASLYQIRHFIPNQTFGRLIVRYPFSGYSLAHTWTMVALYVQHGITSRIKDLGRFAAYILVIMISLSKFLTMLLLVILFIPGERSVCGGVLYGSVYST